MEIQACLHNRDPSGFHNGDLNRFPKHITQWRSKAVHTTEIQAGSHNA